MSICWHRVFSKLFALLCCCFHVELTEKRFAAMHMYSIDELSTVFYILLHKAELSVFSRPLLCQLHVLVV